MHIKITTSYAIKLLLYLATCSTKLTADKLSAYTQISKPSVIKVMQRFKKMGWVVAMEGVCGGYTFIANPSELTLLQVFQIMENSMVVDGNQDMSDRDPCMRQMDDVVGVVYSGLRSSVEKALDRITLEHLMKLQEKQATKRRGGVKGKKKSC